MEKIAVIIPCFNEAPTIEKVVKDFREVLPEACIYVYDNNSTDDTEKLALRAGATVRHEYMQGKGNVLRRAFSQINAQCYVIVDGDDTYSAKQAREMTDLVLYHNADMVIGDRLSSTYYTENKRPFHNMGNNLVRKCINVLFNSKINDIMTGYRVFSYRFIKTFPVLSTGFEVETEMSIHAVDNNMQLENVVIDYKDRQEGSVSKLNTFSDGIKVLLTIVRLFKNYRPQAFFGMIAAVLMFLAVVFFIPVYATYLKTGLVPNFPTLIVCGFAVIAAFISFFSGVILKTLHQKDRQNFELKLYEIQDKYTELVNKAFTEKSDCGDDNEN